MVRVSYQPPNPTQPNPTHPAHLDLVKLHTKFNSRGLEILAFPCNQFGAQESGTHDEILKFVEKFDPDLKTKFHWFHKTSVNGKETQEVFSFLKSALPWDDGTRDVRWNFGKFLIAHDGTPYKRFGSRTPPSRMENDIEVGELVGLGTVDL